MGDDVRSQVEIYQLFSDCLKYFRKKLVLLCQIAHAEDKATPKNMEDTLREYQSEGHTLMSKFEFLLEENRPMAQVFSRFLLRIRQTTQTFALRTSSFDIGSYLQFVESSIKEYPHSLTSRQVVRNLLIKIPKIKFITEKIQAKINSEKNLESIDEQTSESCRYQQEKKISQHFESFDKYLSALENEYKMIQCLNIEKADYRRVYFMALEDQQRNYDNLYQEMMVRNRFIRELLAAYCRDYNAKRSRALQKRAKLSKTQEKMSSINLQGTFSHQQKQAGNKFSERVKNLSETKRIKSEFEMNFEKRSGQFRRTSIMETLKNLPSRKPTLKQRLYYSQTQNTQPSISEKSPENRHESTEIERQGLRKNIFQMKKIQFQGSRIELGPDQFSKRSSAHPEEQKRRNFYKKTQQHFRKKISFITQSRLTRAAPQKLAITPTQTKPYYNLRIQFTQLIQ